MTTTMMMKQIHRFFRAALAESTAFSVYCNLRRLPWLRVGYEGYTAHYAPGFRILLHIERLLLNRVDGFVLLFH